MAIYKKKQVEALNGKAFKRVVNKPRVGSENQLIVKQKYHRE
jgi:hypothetical protein